MQCKHKDVTYSGPMITLMLHYALLRTYIQIQDVSSFLDIYAMRSDWPKADRDELCSSNCMHLQFKHISDCIRKLKINNLYFCFWYTENGECGI